VDLDHDIGKISGNLSTLDPGSSILTVLGTQGISLPVGTTAQRPGTNVAGTIRYSSTANGLEYNNGTAWISIIPGSTPAGSNGSIQYNNNGAFGGISGLVWDSVLSKLVVANATATNTTVEILNGATTADATQANLAALYIEVVTDGETEGMRTYFNRSSPGISGWVTYHYDGATPNIRIIDEDDDPPYVSFRTIGTGTYAAPQYENTFGTRGPLAGATTGFSWKVGSFGGGTEIMSVDSNFLKIPTGTTAQRPATASAGMIRYNTTLGRSEEYNGANWRPAGATVLQVVSGTILASSGTGTVPLDNTAPTSTEGRQIWTQSFTPRSSTSKLIIEHAFTGAVASNSTLITSIFVGTTNIGSTADRIAAGVAAAQSARIQYLPGSTATITISCRSGASTGTSYCNIIGSTTLGDLMVSSYTITEID
jgi:hypothetical protein